MKPDPGTAGPRVLLVGSDDTTRARLTAALPVELQPALCRCEALLPEAVLSEARDQDAGIVLLGAELPPTDRARLLDGLRAVEDLLLITLGPEDSPGAAPAGDDHLRPEDDPGRFLARCIREARLRRAAREAARRAERMAAVAEASGGVAHDFGNLLQVIRGQTQLLRANLGDGGATGARLAAIEGATDQALALVRRLLALGVDSSSQPRSVAVDELLSGLAPILSALLSSGQYVEYDLDCEGARILVDPPAFEQALLNLVTNAGHAMGAGGCVRVRSRRRLLPRPAEVDGLPAVIIEIEDDGCGMPREVAERAFEPFFSTRSATEGSGLGLSSVLEVVQRFGGNAAIESEPGQGTTVCLTLPEHGADGFGAPKGREAQEDHARSREHHLILFVDDEPLVVNVVRNILERAGHAHIIAANADEAEAAFDAHGGRIDLLITDVMMPGRNGRELYEALCAKQPDLPVVFVSGFVDDPRFAEVMQDADRQRLVPKPFRPTQLLEVIEDVLQTSRAPTQP
ncbi:MAG: ATP-binding protein [Pseudomonadales bacterium]|jgi:signal transduction histidine kinase|nr:ATP-binding protein [Pseudomonadales bacterium]